MISQDFDSLLTHYLENGNNPEITPYSHVFVTDEQQRLYGANELQLQVCCQLMDLPPTENIKGCSIAEMYSLYPERAAELCEENEIILQSMFPKYFHSTLIIPKVAKIRLMTVKIPHFDFSKKRFYIFGIAWYLKKIDLYNAENYQLTLREVDCIEKLLEGKSAKGIAEALSLSPRTVENYLDIIKGKLDCDNKQMLISKIKKMGLISSFL